MPDQEDDEQLFGDVSVMLSQSRQVCPDFTVKKLTVRYTGTAGNRGELSTSFNACDTDKVRSGLFLYSYSLTTVYL